MGKILGYYITPHPPIVVPEIGRGEEKHAKNTVSAMEKVASEIASLKPSAIIVVTPHGPIFRDAIAITELDEIVGDFGQFGRADISMKFKIDTELTENIVNKAFVRGTPLVTITDESVRGYGISGKLDHGAMVPLHYINREYDEYNLVHITYGILERQELYSFGEAIKEAVEESEYDVVLVASGDLSHRLSETGPYSYSPNGEVFDRELIQALEAGNSEKVLNLDKELVEEAGECGYRSFCILLGAIGNDGFKGKLLSYEGPFGVGYGVMSFEVGESPYIRLAKESLKHYISHGREMKVPDYVTDEMKSHRRGVFVSFKKYGELRGCIGTIYPTTENTAREIIKNAVEAGQRDPRFDPISEGELKELEVSVDELMEPELASEKELDPKQYGVIVTSGMKRGLLLPDLEGVDTVDYQLAIALQKAGIHKKEDYSIERFKVIRHR